MKNCAFQQQHNSPSICIKQKWIFLFPWVEHKRNKKKIICYDMTRVIGSVAKFSQLSIIVNTNSLCTSITSTMMSKRSFYKRRKIASREKLEPGSLSSLWMFRMQYPTLKSKLHFKLKLKKADWEISSISDEELLEWVQEPRHVGSGINFMTCVSPRYISSGIFENSWQLNGQGLLVSVVYINITSSSVELLQ